MFAGLSHWLAQELRRKLGDVAPYLLKDSQDLVSRIRHIRHTSVEKWHMATIDVKDFYLNGTPDQIIEAILTLWAADDPMKEVLHRVLDFVLHNQYVDDPWEGSDNL
eukprot:1451213-Pyramimonas_sp.AAC.1